MSDIYSALAIVGAIIVASSVPGVLYGLLPNKFSRTRLIFGTVIMLLGILLLWIN